MRPRVVGSFIEITRSATEAVTVAPIVPKRRAPNSERRKRRIALPRLRNAVTTTTEDMYATRITVSSIRPEPRG